MANSWFQFKQFTINQQHAAMKVTTDACLFGAMLPIYHPSKDIKMLDIGAGTGLLSLMAAQKNKDAQILGVELDTATAIEASKNVSNSPFCNQITIINKDILLFNPESKFHHIFSNPPFYEKQLTSPSIAKNKAHHSTTLTLEKLLPLIKNWLLPLGSASIIIPYYRENEVVQRGYTHHLFPKNIIRIKPTHRHAPIRSILLLAQEKQPFLISSIAIKDEGNCYTTEFIELLKPFYLNF